MNTWNYKVVKTQRGMDGEWFRHRTAATFATQEQADEYARSFAVEQAGVTGTKILVIRRKGNAVVSSYSTDEKSLRELLRQANCSPIHCEQDDACLDVRHL